jgi:hypothetical protein
MSVLNRGLWLALLLVSSPLFAAKVPSQRHGLPIDPAARAVETPVVNAARALAEDALAGKGRPLRYALKHAVAVDVHAQGKDAYGRWTEIDADTLLWRTRIDAPGAVSIDLALAPFHLPPGAELWLTDAEGRMPRRFGAADNPKSGEFWTPFVPGDIAYLEVLVPKARLDELRLGIRSVQQGYRSILTGESPFIKSGSCNVDVACSEGNNYREQINAVARYSINGGWCTGQLINNTANDNRRLFISASHCFNENTGVGDQADANTIVVYWKYENPTCRTPGSGASGVPVCPSFDDACVATVSIVQTGGATLLFTNRDSDTTLVELNTAVPPNAQPYWYGWDRSSTAPTRGVVVHHPNSDEKRISFENDPLSESNVYLTQSLVLGNRHWRVADWDAGTTEQGSSGSGLMDAQKRLVGVLSGGNALCGNNLDDYFGRLNAAFVGSGPGSGNIAQHLDPTNSGVMAIDGRGVCAAPTVTLTLDTPNPLADQPVLVTASLSGGTGPYTLSWDVDGDGTEDRRSSGVVASQQQSLRYPDRRNVTVRVSANGADGCTGQASSTTFTVRAPRLAAQAEGTPTQTCGDGDSNFEPGEIWDIPVRVSNSGEDAMNNGFAVFTGGLGDGSSASSGRSDGFGYLGFSSTESSLCRYQAIDMSGATELSPVASSGGVSRFDDGYVANLAVGGSGGFRFYDRDITQLLMSTNGYLSTNQGEGGDDTAGNCGIDNNGSIDGRLQVLHDDLFLQTSGRMRHRQFTTCPRPADIGSASQGCTVFEWNDIGQYVSDSLPPDGNAVFQAVLYHQSFEIVYQYIAADPDAGAQAAIGLQSPDESIRFDYSCSVNNSAAAGRANCFFHPSAAPGTEATVHVVSPAANLGNLGAGASTLVNATAYVDPAAQCGGRAVVSYLGGVDDFTYSFQPARVLDVNLPASGNCQVANQCAAQLASLGAPTAVNGMYFNPNRSGNGQNIFNIGSVLSSAWFTGQVDRKPIWYLLAGPWNPTFSQAKADIRKFTRTSVSPFTVASESVGQAHFTRGGDTAYISSWMLGGVWGGEKLVRFYSASNLPTPNHSGGWYNPGQSGWGLVIDEHKIGEQDSTGMISYLYDEQNQPRWTLGEQFNTSNTVSHLLFYVHCPSCPRFSDFGTLAQPAGTMTRSYQSQTTGTLDTAITLPAPLGGTWNRSALPIQMLTPPLSPSP